MIKKVKFFKISNKTRSVFIDPSLNLKLNLFSIKDLFKIKINSFLKFFYSLLTIFFNFKEYLNFLKLKNTKK